MNSHRAIANGELEVVSDAVLRLTGHAPTTFAEFLSRHLRAAGTWSTGADLGPVLGRP